MGKKKDLFDDFISSMNEQEPIIKTHQPIDEKDTQQDVATNPQRRGRPQKSEGHREPEYINKTFRISKKSAHILDEIAYSSRRPLKDVLEEAVSMLDEKYFISVMEDEKRLREEVYG